MEKIPSSTYIALLWIIFMASCTFANSKDYFSTVAAFQHEIRRAEIQGDVEDVIKANLDNYEKATRAAAKRGAEIIFFPYYGIIPPENRSLIMKYMRFTPNPKNVSVTPCDEAKLFVGMPILHTLSCMAKYNKIVLEANLGSVKHLKNESNNRYNAKVNIHSHVLFYQNGTMKGRYVRERVSQHSNSTRTAKDIFGKYMNFTCFDVRFEKLSRNAKFTNIDDVMFSEVFYKVPLSNVSTQWFQAWAAENKATIISANTYTYMPGNYETGCSNFMGEKSSIVALNYDSVSKLIIYSYDGAKNIKKSPKFDITKSFLDGPQKLNKVTENITNTLSYSILARAKNTYRFHMCKRISL